MKMTKKTGTGIIMFIIAGMLAAGIVPVGYYTPLYAFTAAGSGSPGHGLGGAEAWEGSGGGGGGAVEGAGEGGGSGGAGVGSGVGAGEEDDRIAATDDDIENTGLAAGIETVADEAVADEAVADEAVADENDADITATGAGITDDTSIDAADDDSASIGINATDSTSADAVANVSDSVDLAEIGVNDNGAAAIFGIAAEVTIDAPSGIADGKWVEEAQPEYAGGLGDIDMTGLPLHNIAMQPEQPNMVLSISDTTSSVAPVMISMIDSETAEHIGPSPFFVTGAVGNPFTYLAPHIPGYSLTGHSIGLVENVNADYYSNYIEFSYEIIQSPVTIVCKESVSEKVIRQYGITDPVVSGVPVAYTAPDLSSDYYTLAGSPDRTYLYNGTGTVEEVVYYTKDEVTITIKAVDVGSGGIIGAHPPIPHLRKGEAAEIHAPLIAGYSLLDPSPIMAIAMDREIVFSYINLSDTGVAVKVFAGKIADNNLLQTYIISGEPGAIITVNPATINVPGFTHNSGSAENRYTATVGEPGDIIIIMADVRSSVTVIAVVGGAPETMPVNKVVTGEEITLYPPYIHGYAPVEYSVNGGERTIIPDGFAGYNTIVVADMEIVWYFGAVDAPAAPSAGSLTALVSIASTGQMQPGATVKVYHGSTETTHYTDSTGKVALTGLDFGLYTITASHTDYNLSVYTTTLTASNPHQTIILGLSKATESTTGQTTNASLTAIVSLASTGQSQPGATVRVYGGGKDNTFTADTAGKVTVTGLSYGVYNITASYTGYNTAYSTVSLSSGNANQTVTLSLIQDASSIINTDNNNTNNNNSNPDEDPSAALTGMQDYLQQTQDGWPDMASTAPDWGGGWAESMQQNAYDAPQYDYMMLPRYEYGIRDGFMPLAGFTNEHIKYINGYLDGTMQPDAAVTRAETASIIFRLLAGEEKNNPMTPAFADVNIWEWYAQPIAHLANIGVVSGYYDGLFRPEAALTRAEFVVMLSGFDTLDYAYGGMFSDTDGHWAEPYINSAAMKGWITGYLDGTFKPESNISRAELVTVVNRVLYRGIQVENIPYEYPQGIPYYADLPASHWAYTAMIEAAVGHSFTRKENGYEIWTRLYNP